MTWRRPALAAARWIAGLLLASLLAASAWVISAPEAMVSQAGTQHIVQAQLWSGALGSFAAPPRLRDAVAAQAGGSTVALPFAWPRSEGDADALTANVASAAAPVVTWLRVDIDPSMASAPNLHLYVPRWQTAGRIAVYGDEQLLFHSRGEVAWSGFNHPLWVPLRTDAQSTAPATLWLRIDSLPGAGGAVSSMWVGPEDTLAPRYLLRRMLQTGAPEVLNVAALGLSAFALMVWLRRRTDPTYLLFAVFTLLWVLRSLRYHAGLEPLPIPTEWFTWVTVVSGNAVVLAWYLFVATLVPTAPRWPVPLLCGVVLLSAMVSLPLLSNQVWAATLAPLSYWATIAVGWPANLLMAWFAWRHRGREGMIAAAIGLLHLPISMHDGMVQNYALSPEHLYAWPLSTLARMLMFIYVIVSRYVGALRTAEAASARLAERLQVREAELAANGERLRAVQHAQALAQERQRLMQDIHDGMGSQLMSALKVAESGPLDDDRMARVLRECIDDLKLTVDSMETVDADLLLLLATLRYRLDQRLQGSGIRMRWEVSDLPALDWLDPQGALHILRILQEGVSNVLQHAGATELRVMTGQADGGVYVTLDHDGKAPDPARTGPLRVGGGGKGLGNMQRRADAVGARVGLEAIAGGTRLRLWLPLKRERGTA